MVSFQWLQKKRVVIPRTNHYTRGSWYHGPVQKLPQAMNITQRRSSWAGSCGTPKSTRITTKNWHHTEKKFLGRKSRNTEKYENHHEKSTSHREVREFSRKINIEELKRQKRKKSRSFIVKTTFKSIPEQRKVRELPRKMHTAEVEEAKKCENYHAKPVSDPFNQDHRRTPKSTRITTKNEHRRSWRAGNYENSHTKRTCKHEST